MTQRFVLDSRLWHTVQSRLPWYKRVIVAYLNSCELLSLIMNTEKNRGEIQGNLYIFKKTLSSLGFVWDFYFCECCFTRVYTRNTLFLHHLANINRDHGCSQSAVVFFVYSLLPQYRFSHWWVKFVLYYPAMA